MAVAMAGAFPVAEKAVAREISSSQNPLRELNSFVISEVWLQTCIAKIMDFATADLKARIKP